MIRQAMRSLLRAASTTPTDIYLDMADEDAVLPYVTFQVIANPGDGHQRGDSEGGAPMFQIDVWDDDQDRRDQVGNEILTHLGAQIGITQDNVQIRGFQFSERGDDSVATSSFSREILDVSPVAKAREAVDVTHQGSTNSTSEFLPGGFMDNGEMSLTVHDNPDDEPPVNAAPEQITVTFPSGATLVGQGFLTGYSASWPIGDKGTADMTIKWSGELTYTAAT